MKRILYFAEINLTSTIPNNRSMSLSLLLSVLDLNPLLLNEGIEEMLTYIAKDSWWENRCLLIAVCGSILRSIVNSEDYQVFVSKKNPQASKTYSLENEMRTLKLKA